MEEEDDGGGAAVEAKEEGEGGGVGTEGDPDHRHCCGTLSLSKNHRPPRGETLHCFREGRSGGGVAAVAAGIAAAAATPQGFRAQTRPPP